MKKKQGKSKKTKTPKAKQGWIDPEMAPVCIPEIDRAADNYVAARDDRMTALTEEIEQKHILKTLMVSNNLTEYEYDGKVVTLDGEPNVKVKKKKTPKLEED